MFTDHESKTGHIQSNAPILEFIAGHICILLMICAATVDLLEQCRIEGESWDVICNEKLILRKSISTLLCLDMVRWRQWRYCSVTLEHDKRGIMLVSCWLLDNIQLGFGRGQCTCLSTYNPMSIYLHGSIQYVMVDIKTGCNCFMIKSYYLEVLILNPWHLLLSSFLCVVRFNILQNFFWFLFQSVKSNAFSFCYHLHLCQQCI
jgi:hypothetical protein